MLKEIEKAEIEIADTSENPDDPPKHDIIPPPNPLLLRAVSLEPGISCHSDLHLEYQSLGDLSGDRMPGEQSHVTSVTSVHQREKGG